MRVIKSRAWDRFNAEMIYCDENAKSRAAFYLDIARRRDCGNDLVEMQYTGLKDKNGVEIYEGDVVSCDGRIHTISWHHDSASFYPVGIFTLDSFYHRGPPVNQWLVIGNMYEIPELPDGKT